MKIHENIVQGSEVWHELRANHFTASEAPAMMGESKYKGRTALMNEKKGVKEKVSDHLQKLFDKGHETEDKARSLLEFETAESFEPIVATLEVEGLPLLASLDGISEDHKTIFEHKLWNETLAENVRNQVLEPTYYWQLEQQLLVAGAERALFVVSDGTGVNREMMYYTSQPERRSKLIAGWHEFKKDFEDHEVKAKQEVIVARKQDSFPLIQCSVEGSTVVSNLGEYIPVIQKLADEQMSLILETDQDFADKEAFNKNVKAGRATLKTQATDIEKQFESLAEFNGYVKQADTILQKLQSHGEKQVKEAKATKKLSIVNNARAEFNKHLAELSETINKVQITQIVIDFEAVMKGKRSFEKMEEAVNSELAKAKIEANEIAQVIRKNLDSLTELAKDHKFLFSDHAMLLLKDNDDLVNLIKARIAEHEQAEAERKRQEQERIEREAKEKAEREAKAKLEAEEKRIRDEERAKVEAEQQAEIKTAKSEPVIINSKDTFIDGETVTTTEQATAQQVSTHDKLNNLMYALTKHAARNSFIDFLEEWGLSEEDYAEVKAYLNSSLGEVKTYL
jgi:putative phage-type endonuclease